MRIEEETLDSFYKVSRFYTENIEAQLRFGLITEKDKFLAAKQILLGLALLYTLTLFLYLCSPREGLKLLEICITTFAQIASWILGFYFGRK